MTEPAVTIPCQTSPLNRSSPPSVRLPRLVGGLALTLFRRGAMRHWTRRYGRVFGFNVPFFGRCVAVSDPALARAVFAASPEQLTNYQPNVSAIFGMGSIFALDGGPHHDRRRLLAPAFHGRSLRHHEAIIVDETLRECANWPESKEFPVLDAMTRITLNVILRTIFGAQGAEVDELRDVGPRHASIGSVMVKFMPVPKSRTRRYSPWRRMDKVRGDFNQAIFALIERAEADPQLDRRTDVLALLLRGMPAERSQMSRQDICDELVGLIGAGHETTTAALCWAFERLRRHPDVLAGLVDEVDEGGGEFRRATILEVLRARPVIDLPGRWVTASHFDLGEWRIPHGHNIFVSLADLQENSHIFPTPQDFDPNRFRDKQSAPGWLAFGHGARRCLGAEFALNEIDVVLRTVLQNFQIHTDSAADEKSHFRGVAHAPRRGGRVIVTRRRK